MDELEKRWNTMMVQAQNFAARDQLLDGVARAKLVRSEVRAAIARVTDAAVRERYQARLVRVEKQVEHLEAALAAWRASIEATRSRRLESAEQEFTRPLPGAR